MRSNVLQNEMFETTFANDDFCTAALPVSTYDSEICGSPSEHGGCIFKVGNDMYFVPTQRAYGDDVLYVACDAQKIEGPLEGWRTRLALGDSADDVVENAILDHLTEEQRSKKQGESFVVMRDGKTFRL